MTTTEPEWDAEGRRWALALEHYEDHLCGCGCGFPASVAHAPDNEGLFDVEAPIRCHARTALVLAQDRFGDDVQAASALMWERPTLRSGRGSG